ncbi:hypothetical protein L917_14604, partial [Phytophthora nicotianae]
GPLGLYGSPVKENRRPGGSGSIVLKVGHDSAEYEVCFLSSMSYAAQTTTNNAAENLELLQRLRACGRLSFTSCRGRQHAHGLPLVPSTSFPSPYHWSAKTNQE